MYIRELLNEVGSPNENIQIGDVFELELDDIVIETTVVELMDDGPVLCVDSTALSYISLNEEKVRLDPKCWKGKKIGNPKTKMKGGVRVNNCVPAEGVAEAEYQGRNVPLGKPMAGDVKKSKVYVKGPKGNVVKVNFGDKKMRIKKSNPNRRKSFRARHHCENPGPRWKARYWSCRAW